MSFNPDLNKAQKVIFYGKWQSWCSGYHYFTTSFNEAWTQVLRRFKSCSQCVRDLLWWGSLTMVPAGNKTQCLLLVNHTTKTIRHHHKIITLTNLFQHLLSAEILSEWKIEFILTYLVRTFQISARNITAKCLLTLSHYTRPHLFYYVS